MESKSDEKKLIVLFILVAYGLSAIGDSIWIYSGQAASPAAFITILAPSIAAAAVYFKSKKKYKPHLLCRCSFKEAVCFISIPIIYFALAYHIYFIIIGNANGFGINIKDTLISIILYIFMAVLEETGWRGVLLPLMQEAFSFKKAIILNGLVWGFWHYPLIIGGFLLNYFNLFQGLVLFTIEVLLMTAIIANLQKELKMISLWPIIFLHAAHNVLCDLMVGNAGAESGAFIGESGYFVVLFIAICTLIVVNIPRIKTSIERSNKQG